MPQKQILVVEDEYAIAANLRLELTDLGYEVAGVAASGEEAVQLAEQTQPDLVLMDIALPGNLDGVEASEDIPDRYDIPVVFLTAYADEPTLRRAKLTEPYGYLVKPYAERELRTTIETALFKHRMQRLSEGMRRWLTAVFQSIADGLLVTNAKGHVALLNHAAEILTGWSSDEAFGQPFDTVVNLVGQDSRSLTAQALEERGPVQLPADAVLAMPNGARKRIEGTVAPVHDDTGECAGLVLIFRESRAARNPPPWAPGEVAPCAAAAESKS